MLLSLNFILSDNIAIAALFWLICVSVCLSYPFIFSFCVSLVHFISNIKLVFIFKSSISVFQWVNLSYLYLLRLKICLLILFLVLLSQVGFFFPLCFLFFSFTAQFELTVLSLFLFTLSSTGFEVTYSISLLLVVWIVSKEEFGKHSEILNALHCIGLTAFSGILTPQWPGL